MPPPRLIFRLEKSSLANSGLLARALNSVLRQGKTLNLKVDNSLTKPGMSRGFGISRLQAPMRVPIMLQTVSAKMWYSGRQQTKFNCSLPSGC
jgi:hypothetical protein